MIAFHGKPEVKQFYLDRVRAHREADQLIHGMYWENGKGCAVGCTVHSSNHAAYEVEMGIPRLLAKLEDGIFERMTNGRALQWPEQFLSAIEPGADLSMVWPQFGVWLMVDPQWGVLQFAQTEQSKKAIRAVADGYQSMVENRKEQPDWNAIWSAAAAARLSAAAAAADAAADATARWSADAARLSAATARWSAATARWSAAAAADAAAVAFMSKRGKASEAQADKLLDLLRAAPMAKRIA